MKKTIIVFSGLLVFMAWYLGACVHEIPHDFCSTEPVILSIAKTDASSAANDGSITATATGGSGFLYSLNGANFTDNGTFTGLHANTMYRVVAKNSHGCTDTAEVEIGSIAAPNPCSGASITVNATKTDATSGQNNGSIAATASPAGNYTYSINNGVFQSTGNFNALAAATYTVTAKNANGCTGTSQVTIGTNNVCAGVTITVSTTQTDPSAGQSNGSITATATGGTGFSYSLNNGTFQASGNFTGLAAGTYTVTAKSSAGCTGLTTVTLAGAVSCASTVITINNAIVNVLPCATPAANGKITITAAGSSGFTYNINGGAYQTSNVFGTLAAGTFTVGVKDVNGCTKTATATVGTAVKGPLFTEVRALITARCGGSNCHMNGKAKAGYNFDNDCSIVTAWSAINTSSVTSSSMPNSPQALLTAAEKLKITNWINAGHTYGN